MQADGGAHDVVVKLRSFHYAVDGLARRQVAKRGDRITVNDADYELGTRLDAFVEDGAELTRHGTLPAFDFDPDDEAEIDAWMRSASASDVAAAIAEASARGVDVTGAMLTGELSRGTEARAEIIDLLRDAQPAEPTLDEQLAAIREIEDRDERAAAADAIYQTAQGEGVEQDALEALGAQLREAVDGPPPDEQPASDKVADILEFVGTDTGKAAAALERENEKGDAARPTLVAALTQVIEGGDSS